MPRGSRHAGYEAGGPARKPRMQLVEVSKAVVFLADDVKATMTLAATADLPRQAKPLRRSNKELSRTRERLAAATRAFDENGAEAERAERARGQVSQRQERSRQELAAAAAALREKDALVEGLLARVTEMEVEAAGAERARAQAAERLERSQRELAAATAALRERDGAIQGLLLRAAEDRAAAERAAQQEQRQSQQEAASARASLLAACREAWATAQRARELERRVLELEAPAVAPSEAAASPESACSSRESSTDACPAIGSVSGDFTSVCARRACDALERTVATQAPKTHPERIVDPLCTSQEEIRPRKISAALRIRWMARTPDSVTASFALNIDAIGYGVAAWAPGAWAPVRWQAARQVVEVYANRIECWRMAARFSLTMLATDRHVARGSVTEIGLPASAKLDFEKLRVDVARTARGDDSTHIACFLRRIKMVLCIFEQYRLEWQDLYWAAHCTCNRLVDTYNATRIVLNW